jgi:hypothetical protein
MVSNRSSRRALPVLLLLAVFALASVPAQGQTVRRPAKGFQAVTVSGENGLSRLWSSLVSLMKEGVLIDPNGGKHGVTVSPSSGGSDEGMSIDPNGRQ